MSSYMSSQLKHLQANMIYINTSANNQNLLSLTLNLPPSSFLTALNYYRNDKIQKTTKLLCLCQHKNSESVHSLLFCFSQVANFILAFRIQQKREDEPPDFRHVLRNAQRRKYICVIFMEFVCFISVFYFTVPYVCLK